MLAAASDSRSELVLGHDQGAARGRLQGGLRRIAEHGEDDMSDAAAWGTSGSGVPRWKPRNEDFQPGTRHDGYQVLGHANGSSRCPLAGGHGIKHGSGARGGTHSGVAEKALTIGCRLAWVALGVAMVRVGWMVGSADLRPAVVLGALALLSAIALLAAAKAIRS